MKFSDFIKTIIPKKGDASSVVAGKVTVLTVGVAIVGSATVFAGVTINDTIKANQSLTSSFDEPVSSAISSISSIVSQTSSATSKLTYNSLVITPSTTTFVNAYTSSAPVTSESTTTNSTNVAAGTTSTATTSTTPVVNAQMPDGYLEKFQDWYNINTDIVGYLNIPNTVINYPVLQSNDNAYYLNHNIYKQSYGWGNIFADYRVNFTPSALSKNVMLYGHGDTWGGTQLAAMRSYQDVNFYKSHPILTFDTVYGEAQYKVITMFIEDTSPSRGSDVFPFWDMLNTRIDQESEFLYYMQEAYKRSYFTSTVDVLPSDQLLSIQVCQDTNSSNYNRLVLVARKVRAGESTYVDTSGAYQN